MKGAVAFAAGLQGLAVGGVDLQGDLVRFKIDVPAGRHAGETWLVGVAVPADFPDVPPGGPHVSPPLHHPHGAVHPSTFGADWIYWSRPIPNWAKDPTVRAYLRHIYTLFAQIA